MARMQETRIKTFMQMELVACRDELDWLIRCHNCTAYNCPEEEYSSRPLPIPPDYIENLQSRLGKVMKVILPPTLKIILKTYYQAPVHPQHQKMSSCSQEEQLGRSFEVQSDDKTVRHRDGEHNRWSDHKLRRKRTSWSRMALRAWIRGEISFFKPRLGWTSKHHKSPPAISNWRCFGNNKGQQRRVQIVGETTAFKQTSPGTRKQQQQHESPPARRLRSAGNSEGRRRLSRASSLIQGDEA